MRYRRLGRTALQVSELCLGTMNFGPETPEPESGQIMDRALELGINFYDTANRYGGSQGYGATEEIVGRWFAQGGGRREKVVLATKAYGAMSDWPNDGRLSARHIRAACDASLRRMQTDHIDLYQMHRPDPLTSMEETLDTFDALFSAGKIGSIGTSTFSSAQLDEVHLLAGDRGWLRPTSEQPPYSLLARGVETDVLPTDRKSVV